MRSRLGLGLSCVVLACRVASGGDSGTPPSLDLPLPTISGQQFTGLIVPRLVNFDDSWTPTEAQVVAAEPNVQRYVVSQCPKLRSTLSAWFRQYSGITKSGNRMLRIDFFDTRHFPLDTLRHPLTVCDGDGDSTLVVVCGLEDGICSWL